MMMIGLPYRLVVLCGHLSIMSYSHLMVIHTMSWLCGATLLSLTLLHYVVTKLGYYILYRAQMDRLLLLLVLMKPFVFGSVSRLKTLENTTWKQQRIQQLH